MSNKPEDMWHYAKEGGCLPVCGVNTGMTTSNPEEVKCQICKSILFERNRKYFPTKDCNCEDWKHGIQQLNGAIANHCNHHGNYQAEYFRFCPWCGKQLGLKPSERFTDKWNDLVDRNHPKIRS